MNRNLLRIDNIETIDKYFEEYDKITGIDNLSKSSKFIFFKTKKELEKRKINFRITEYILLYEKNMDILSNFLFKYHRIKENIGHKKLKKEDFKKFSIKNFYKLEDAEKFNAIFDYMLLSNPKIDKKKYLDFFKQKRENLNLIKAIKPVSKCDIAKQKGVRYFKSNVNFVSRIKKPKNINLIVYDLEKKEFESLFSLLSVIFRNSKYRLIITKDLYKLTTMRSTKSQNIFLFYDANFIAKHELIKKKKYVLSLKDLKSDLYSFLSTKPDILFLSQNTKDLMFSEKKSIYNQKFFVSNRIIDLIDLLRKEGNEFL